MRKLCISIVLIAHTLANSSLVSAQDTPYLFILGVAQDAGYPQVGCYQPHCMKGWEDSTSAALRLQLH